MRGTSRRKCIELARDSLAHHCITIVLLCDDTIAHPYQLGHHSIKLSPKTNKQININKGHILILKFSRRGPFIKQNILAVGTVW